ncbi:hypothetical protein TanjilG_31503 [Lupinus angustifolius]|uniref:Uncharacterized protein n=1 Tax=Lupinus angustifolius TaxID=3871 RepID=A0A4P1RUQ2_LUPAN|nr:hypothetical protein TanjilG_31503 [Lupinus angustifolius]
MDKGNNSYGTSWADQWDNGPDPRMVGHDKNNNNKYKQKIGEGFDKTKSVASTGVKKLKDGTSVGFNWIKTKCSNIKQKN